MKSDAVIRPYRPEDLPAIEKIVKLIWTVGMDYVREQVYGFQIGGQPWYEHKLQAVRGDAQHRPDYWFVTECDGQVVGFCSYHIDTKTGIGIVGLNGLHPDVQGQGLGSLQLRFILKKISERGMTIVEVITGLNEGHGPARRLYERAGFKPLFANQMYWMILSDKSGKTDKGLN